ncbi:MAG: SDR family oxidoreductase [Pseudomonadota bacterium]
MTAPVFPDLKGRTVYITGGATGIGEAFVRAFVAQGSRVAFFDVDDGSGNVLASELAGTGAEIAYQSCDLASADTLLERFSNIASTFGPAEVLICNAANDVRHSLNAVTSDQWDRLTAINLKHQAFAAQAVAPSMTKRGRGAIINLSSNSYRLGMAGYPAYVASKAGVIGLTRGLARELGVHGVRVNAIAPGWVMTEKQIRLWLTPEGEAELLEQQMLKTKIQPKDVADTALFMASDASRMITGEVIFVTGGRS